MKKNFAIRFLFSTLAGAVLALAVHADARANAPAGHYVVSSSNGTVMDTRSKLTWQQGAQTSGLDLAGAQAFCTGLGGGWRLPTLKELLTLFDYSQTAPPYIDQSAFPGTPATFWSTTVSGTSGGWVINFNLFDDEGSLNLTQLDLTSAGNNVKCVR